MLASRQANVFSGVMMGAAFDPFSNQFDALALRLPALGKDAGDLAGARPVVIFAEQGAMHAGLSERPTDAGQPDQLRAGGEESLGDLGGPAREKMPGRLPEKFELGRVIFIIDRSSSMGGSLRSGHPQLKLEHIIERIGDLAEDYFPPSTNVSLITLDSFTESFELGDVRGGALHKLKSDVARLTPRGGTDFVGPLDAAWSLLDADAASADPKAEKKRPVIVFLTDGQDSSGARDLPADLMHRLGKLNASIFIIGIGEDYSMPRLIKLAGHAGASSWSHLPMDDKALDALDVQLPEMIHQVLTCDNYFKVSAEGTYDELAAVTPTIRFAPLQHELIYPGYVRDAVGMLFERESNLRLKLIAGRSVDDREAFTQEIPIVDIGDAVGKFEHAQRAEDLNQRLLVLRALLNRDVALLQEMARVNPAMSDQLGSYVQQLQDAHGGGSHDLYSSMTQTGNTSLHFMPHHMRQAPKAPANPNDTNQDPSKTVNIPAMPRGNRGGAAGDSVNLHSGGLGALEKSDSIDSLPPIQPGKANARAYDQAQPQRNDYPVLTVVKPIARQIPLVKFEEGKKYIIGRLPRHDDAQALCIAEGAISRRHCQISFDGKQYLLQDLNSQNGTWHNGRKLASGEQVQLQNNDQIAATAKWVFAFTLPPS